MATLESYTNLIDSTNNIAQLNDIRDYATKMLKELGADFNTQPCKEFLELFDYKEIIIFRRIFESVKHKTEYRLERLL